MGGVMALVAKVAAALQMAQGATAVVVIVVSATTATLLVTGPERARDDVARNSAPAVVQSASRAASPSPAVAVALSVVPPSTACPTLQASRTATDAALRAAEQSAGRRVQELRQGWRDADQEKVNTVVNGATAKLRDRLGATLGETASLASQATACDGASRTVSAAAAAKLDAILLSAKAGFDAIVKEAAGANVAPAPAINPGTDPVPGGGTTPSGAPQGNEQRGQRTDAGGNVTK